MLSRFSYLNSWIGRFRSEFDEFVKSNYNPLDDAIHNYQTSKTVQGQK